MTNSFYYYINLNERGEFNADIRDANDNTLWEIVDANHLIELVDDGFISHYHDIPAIKAYLINMTILPADSLLHRGNESRFSY